MRIDEQLSHLDRCLISGVQKAYEVVLDNFGIRIGTFRMTLALVPIALDLVIRSHRGSFLVQASTTLIFLIILFFMFYNFSTMRSDNWLQTRDDLGPINAASHYFRLRTYYTRLFYLSFFTLSAILYYDLAGIGLLSIVYTRCIMVRARIVRQHQISLSLHSA